MHQSDPHHTVFSFFHSIYSVMATDIILDPFLSTPCSASPFSFVKTCNFSFSFQSTATMAVQWESEKTLQNFFPSWNIPWFSHGYAIIEYFIQINTNRQMSSNKQNQLQSLYLKEFFGRYFERKDMLEMLSAFGNGLKVIEILVEKIEQQLNVVPQQKQSNKLSNTYASSDIDREGAVINQTLENIYNRLQNIFNQDNLKREVQTDFSPRVSTVHENEDELYQMLNNYKNDYKRQKSERMKANKENSTLNLHIQKITEDKIRLQGEMESMNKHFKELQQKNASLEADYLSLKQHLEQLETQIEDYQIMEAAFAQMKMDNQQLTLKLVQSQKHSSLLEQKFKAIDQLILTKVRQNDQKWEQLISKKLESTDIYKNPACKAFKNFLKIINKENSSSNVPL